MPDLGSELFVDLDLASLGPDAVAFAQKSPGAEPPTKQSGRIPLGLGFGALYCDPLSGMVPVFGTPVNIPAILTPTDLDIFTSAGEVMGGVVADLANHRLILPDATAWWEIVIGLSYSYGGVNNAVLFAKVGSQVKQQGRVWTRSQDAADFEEAHGVSEHKVTAGDALADRYVKLSFLAATITGDVTPWGGYLIARRKA